MLNAKHRKFCDYILEGMKHPDAYAKVYPGAKDSKNINYLCNRILSRDDVKKYLREQKRNASESASEKVAWKIETAANILKKIISYNLGYAKRIDEQNKSHARDKNWEVKPPMPSSVAKPIIDSVSILNDMFGIGGNVEKEAAVKFANEFLKATKFDTDPETFRAEPPLSAKKEKEE
jgi:hypothetical protein